ncbi:MAG: peptidylprolyl isomerase [Hyphomicrobiales bacterium]|nr:peptidylprolyl isomerase [Hyphomicrobiales bacterium]
MNRSIQPTSTPRRQISVNGRVIPHASIAREAQNHPAATSAEAWIAAARALALRELLAQESKRLGVVATPAADEDGRVETVEEAAMRALVESEVQTPDPSEDECRRYYENNSRRFRSAPIVEAAHILIAAAPDDRKARAKAEARANALGAHLTLHPERFADLAREVSDCPSGKQNGNLGQMSPGDTAPEFEAVLFGLSVGDITAKPIASRFGFHIVKLERRIEGKQIPYEFARARIAAYLAEAVRRRALSQYVAVLASKADLRGVEFVRPENLI